MVWEWVAVLLLATVPAVFFKYKFNVEVQGPLVLWRTKRGLKLLKRLARYKRFWGFFADLGIIFSLGVFGAYYLIKTSKEHGKIFAEYIIFIIAAVITTLPSFLIGQYINGFWYTITLLIGGFGVFILLVFIQNTLGIIGNYLTQTKPEPGVALIIPGISVPLSALVSLVVLIIVHEFAHGIVAMTEKIKVRSLGLLTAGIIPIGAFTEPDERELKKASSRKRLRTFSAGSMANFAVAFLLLGIFIPAQLTLAPDVDRETATYSEYYYVQNVINGSSAYAAGITPGTKILNAKDIFQEKIPGRFEMLVTDKGNFTVQRNQSGLLGVSGYFAGLKDPSLGFQVKKVSLEIITWTTLLNFVIGAMNFMPFAIFDGSRIFEDMIRFYTKNKKLAKRTVNFFTLFILILLLINALPYFVSYI